MKKRVLAILLAVIMVASLAPMSVAAEVTSLTGAGTEADPYLINNIDELKRFRDQVNAGDKYTHKYIKLTADIDVDNEEWTPIGLWDTAFQGYFDGNNKTISNLKITSTDTGNNEVVGLFGRTNNKGWIKNLTLENAITSGTQRVGTLVGECSTFDYANIKLTGHVEVYGDRYVGGIAGKNASGDWTDITIDVDSTSYVKSKSNSVGGVVSLTEKSSQHSDREVLTLKNITSNINVIGDSRLSTY